MTHLPLPFERTMRALYVAIFDAEPAASWFDSTSSHGFTLVEAGAYASDPANIIYACYSYLTSSEEQVCYVEVSIRRHGRLTHIGPLEDLSPPGDQSSCPLRF